MVVGANCSRCRSPKDSAKHERCTAQRKENSRKSYLRRRKPGWCFNCKGPTSAPLHQKCKQQKAKQRAAQWKEWRAHGLCGSCGGAVPDGYANCDACRERTRLGNLAIKTLVLRNYGSVCACCGEDRIMFLELDHVNGGGTKERIASKRSGVTFYRWLKKQNFPVGLQVLCSNCNHGRHFNGGVCPHKDPKTPRIERTK